MTEIQAGMAEKSIEKPDGDQVWIEHGRRLINHCRALDVAGIALYFDSQPVVTHEVVQLILNGILDKCKWWRIVDVQSAAEKLHVYEMMRLIVILLHCPLQHYHVDLAATMSFILTGVHKSVKSVLVQQLSDAYKNHATQFEQTVNVFRRVVCNHYAHHAATSSVYRYMPANAVYPQSQSILATVQDDFVISSVRVLSMLHSVNEFAVDKLQRGTLIPYWLFYCTAQVSAVNVTQDPDANVVAVPRVLGQIELPEVVPISDTTDLKQLYFNHLALATADPSLMATKFSLFNYPLLVDVGWKQRLLRIESLSLMSLEFESTFVHQGFVNNMRKMLNVGVTGVIDANLQPQAGHAVQQLEQAAAPYLLLDVRRDCVLLDTLEQLDHQSLELHKPLKVRFWGEEGHDQGGVQKEYFQLIVDAMTDLFQYDEDTRMLWLAPYKQVSENHYGLLGTVLALALYNGVMINLPMPTWFFFKLLNADVTPTLDDLRQLQPQTCRGLQQLLAWDEYTQGAVADVFCKTFDISYTSTNGSIVTHELIPGGSGIDVTVVNRRRYVQLYVSHILSVLVAEQFKLIHRGFQQVAQGPRFLQKSSTRFPRVIDMLNANELQLLLTGISSQDEAYSCDKFAALQRACSYEDFTATEPYIVAFWDIVLHKFSTDQRKKFLLFVTSSDRIPVGGLGQVQIVIQRNGGDVDRLPTSLTCFGRLLLPIYATTDKLYQKLVVCIEESKGFGLI